mmetsp:Transcript_41186/g.30285  ORF Transcript_41186/g.30285 Transcript_41186/m.30285 type:complete len:100 (+) Transcript_41186:39-338(+)
MFNQSKRYFSLPFHEKKYQQYLRPNFFDTVKRQRHMPKKIAYHSQDPIFFDYRLEKVNGGIQVLVNHLKNSNNFRLPLRNMAYLMYHMSKADIYDLEVF